MIVIIMIIIIMIVIIMIIIIIIIIIAINNYSNLTCNHTTLDIGNNNILLVYQLW